MGGLLGGGGPKVDYAAQYKAQKAAADAAALEALQKERADKQAAAELAKDQSAADKKRLQSGNSQTLLNTGTGILGAAEVGTSALKAKLGQ